MLVKFFPIFAMSASCALAMLYEQRPYELHKIHATHHIEDDLKEIERLETSLRSDDRTHLLRHYTERGERFLVIF